MIMRDKLKSREYFEMFIEKRNSSHTKRKIKFERGKIPTSRIQAVKSDMAIGLIKRNVAMYSMGNSVEDLNLDLPEVLDLICEYWPGTWKIANNEGQNLNQYSATAYKDLLRIVSISFLLDIPDDQFFKIIKAIDKDQVKDLVLEEIIVAKISDREQLNKESYLEYFFIPEMFKSLRSAILTKNKLDSEKLVKHFIEEEWFLIQDESHTSEHNTYFGYWCFGAAAITCIKGLDDSSYRDHPYYPKDLADYYRANQ